MILCNDSELFYNETRKYFDSLIRELPGIEGKEYVHMDQLVPPYQLGRYSNYFDKIKILVIDRDPRDLYLLNKLHWSEGWIPSDNVETYVKWFRLIRRRINFNDDENNVLRLRFEDCVMHYDETIARVESFLGLSQENHVFKKKYFNPDRSKRNMRLWEGINKFEEEVKFIEQELKEFCYE